MDAQAGPNAPLRSSWPLQSQALWFGPRFVIPNDKPFFKDMEKQIKAIRSTRLTTQTSNDIIDHPASDNIHPKPFQAFTPDTTTAASAAAAPFRSLAPPRPGSYR